MAPSNKKVSPSRKKLTRKNTIEQAVEEGQSFLQGGTYDGPDYFPDSPPADDPTSSVLGKRKVTPVTRYADEIEVPQPRPRSVSPVRRPARSPPRKKSKPSPAKPKTRSASPKKTKSTKSSGVRKARKPTPASMPAPAPITTPAPVPSRPTVRAKNPLPITWEYKSDKPSFGVHAGRGKCWMANESGDVFGFNMSGDMERHIKLPAGVKSIVSDMSMWLYAGCDNGIVYDLSHEAEPREAYRFDDLDDSKLTPAAQSLALLQEHHQAVIQHIEKQSTATQATERKPRHIVFAIDQSYSMNGKRIREVAANLQMIWEYNLQDGDIVSLITFDSDVQQRFSRVVKGSDTDRYLRDFIYSKEFLDCDNMTAFYDALKMSYDQFDETADEDQWVIVLTDGDDNKSKLTHPDIVQLAQNRDVNLIAIYVSTSVDGVYHRIKSMCDATKKGLTFFANANDDSNGITSAFKHIAQLLSSKIMWMDIRDGLLTLSDDDGRVVACSMEGHPMWEQKSAGDCGWMVRSDFEGVYHGHSQGVTKYSAMDGKQLWHSALDTRVLFGWLDKTTHMLYVASGKQVVSVACDDGAVSGTTFDCDADVISTAATYGSEHIYCGDNQGFLYAFDQKGKREVKMETQRGSILSMHFADNHLFAVTSHGYLLCIEVDHLVDDPKYPKNRSVTRPEGLAITLPDSTMAETSTPDDGVVLGFRRALTEDELVVLAAAVHNKDANMVKAEGTEHPIEEHEGLRCVKAGNLLVIEQDPNMDGKYAAMAKKGDQVTWVCLGGRWALVINGKVTHNETSLLAYPTNAKEWDTTKPVQFPKKLRQEGHQYVVEQLVLSESGEFYRVQGQIRRLLSA